MNIAFRTTLTLAASALLLSACVYAPMMQSSYAFDRHPGVVMEVWQDYGYMTTRLINRSTVDKCAWTDTQPSRVLHVGEVWQFSQVQSPGNVGVANILPADPNCTQARTDYTPRG